ncbi:MAG: glutamine synthetase [Planctomycetota bacterium]|jgi:glutamine synthetase
MTKYKFEYLWLDGYKPIANLRSKTKIIEFDEYNGELDRLPPWNFDGSSTKQAAGDNSEVVLKPVRVYKDPERTNGYLVVAETYSFDGKKHVSNTRGQVNEKDLEGFWFGFEQEYVLMDDSGRPVGFPSGGYPEPQGPYYCAVGNQYVSGRDIVEEHLDNCLAAGLGITGVNAEVMLGQWEFQCFGHGLKASDDLLVARYFLFRASERHGLGVELHPKPIKGDWNGSGMHANFSWPHLRDIGGEGYIKKILAGFEKHHAAHLAEYGAYNDQRLTGEHETASMDKFTYGVADRGASIRIPIFTVQDDWKGYLEDRRPASNADPYRITNRIVATVIEAHKEAIS